MGFVLVSNKVQDVKASNKLWDQIEKRKHLIIIFSKKVAPCGTSQIQHPKLRKRNVPISIAKHSLMTIFSRNSMKTLMLRIKDMQTRTHFEFLECAVIPLPLYFFKVFPTLFYTFLKFCNLHLWTLLYAKIQKIQVFIFQENFPTLVRIFSPSSVKSFSASAILSKLSFRCFSTQEMSWEVFV